MPLLIVSLHARYLARSAWRAGRAVSVVDLFNDMDTRSFAAQSKKLTPMNGGFDADTLIDEIDRFCPLPNSLVVGAGFEDKPALLERLAQGRELFGNTPETIRRVKDPATFFPLLDALTIPHPETAFTPPLVPKGWLMKQAGGHGGTHIRVANGAAWPDANCYYQRIQKGSSCSALFLANGNKARVLGFNEQFVTGQFDCPYGYAGAINRAPMQQRVRADIVSKLDSLVSACNLVGLNSIDFITAGENYWVVEVNPRPSATMDLYDDDFPTGLLDWHLRACQGELPESSPVCMVRAHNVVYASHAFHLKPRFRFPEWCSDIPQPGSEFMPGAPVCLVHAEGSSPAEVKRLIEQRRSRVLHSLVERAA